MEYPLHNLNDKDFEALVASICRKILGTGVIEFSEGKDGGRDAKFTARAENFPSKAKPWEGRFIIQAKFTSNPIGSCSSGEFQTILDKEIITLKKLKQAGKVDYYLLFTNKKLSGLADPKIEDKILSETGVQNTVIGLEQIQAWLKEYPEIVKVHDLHKLFLPFHFDEEDIREVITAF